jgi:hypothetical protein
MLWAPFIGLPSTLNLDFTQYTPATPGNALVLAKLTICSPKPPLKPFLVYLRLIEQAVFNFEIMGLAQPLKLARIVNYLFWQHRPEGRCSPESTRHSRETGEEKSE